MQANVDPASVELNTNDAGVSSSQVAGPLVSRVSGTPGAETTSGDGPTDSAGVAAAGHVPGCRSCARDCAAMVHRRRVERAARRAVAVTGDVVHSVWLVVLSTKSAVAVLMSPVLPSAAWATSVPVRVDVDRRAAGVRRAVADDGPV